MWKKAAACKWLCLQTTTEAQQTSDKTNRIWPEGATSAFQDCFMHTNWEVFKTAPSKGDQTYIEVYAEAMTCTEDVTVVKSFTARGNRKPLMTAEVRSLLTAYDAKRNYTEKIQGHICDKAQTNMAWGPCTDRTSPGWPAPVYLLSQPLPRAFSIHHLALSNHLSGL